MRKARTEFKICKIDPYLKPYEHDIELRMKRYLEIHEKLFGDGNNVAEMANGYLYYGLHRTDTGWIFREWAPGADEMHLIGDFNGWDRLATPMKNIGGGNWEVFIPGRAAIQQGQHIKVCVTRGGQWLDRVPAYIRATDTEGPNETITGKVYTTGGYQWHDDGFRRKTSPLFIYEAHVGMAQEKEGIGTWREFADNILPRIKRQGYNCVQLMAVAEHPYYASFGYQVTNFFAPSCRFGSPDDLKYLIDTAHRMGIAVIMDLVHSHACTNEGEGLSMFDGTDGQYFKPGIHKAWNTRLFDYGKYEVVHFLLSNIKYWMMEYHFDGFRFDGVTSMLYHNHGLGEVFTGYDKYFSLNTDVEAVNYLQLATELIHMINPKAIAIAEDMSGMPGMCLPTRYGGIGFDYRMSMGVPDYWIKTLKCERDEDWDIGRMWYELTTCRPQEKTIAYCECHDQSLVGDKTLIFRMADAEMYTGMDKESGSLAVGRAVALYNMIRLITASLAGEGWLNFMGNEFGHPEWIDFPREGNGWSCKYARRQWSLADNGYLRYGQMLEFDKQMLHLLRKYHIMVDRDARNLWIDHEKKLIAYARGNIIFVFNFHPNLSADGFWLPVGAVGEGEYAEVFDTDRKEFGGQGRIEPGHVYYTQPDAKRGVGFGIYVPCRTALVLEKLKHE